MPWNEKYEPVIGLEVHAQLLTKSKTFCGCSTKFGNDPNSNVCPICLGMPGVLPVMNKQAFEFAVMAALALNCEIPFFTKWDRKSYYYPDLPKNYQISQYDLPLSRNGFIEIPLESGQTKRIRITRAHLEEDAGKNLHELGGGSVVDLNRAGTPLCEIVGEPDLRSPAEAAGYLRALRDVLIFLGVNDGNLEEGSFRCDANVSIRPAGTEKLGTRVELKNIEPPPDIKQTMEKQMTAERSRRAVVTEAEGAKASAVLRQRPKAASKPPSSKSS